MRTIELAGCNGEILVGEVEGMEENMLLVKVSNGYNYEISEGDFEWLLSKKTAEKLPRIVDLKAVSHVYAR